MYEMTFIFFPIVGAALSLYGSRNTRVARAYIRTVYIAVAIVAIAERILGSF